MPWPLSSVGSLSSLPRRIIWDATAAAYPSPARKMRIPTAYKWAKPSAPCPFFNPSRAVTPLGALTLARATGCVSATAIDLRRGCVSAYDTNTTSFARTV